MRYVSYINQALKTKLAAEPDVVSFGQNVSLGSCLSGLTRGLPGHVINTPNSESTLTGIGFGLMLEGAKGAFFMKQQDFLLLGLDHLVSTWNAVRNKDGLGSFTIVPIVVDHGYEGAQSCLNNLSDFCSFGRIPGYTISNRADADQVIDARLTAPGLRIICVSQRLFGQDILGEPPQGADVTVVSTNFAYAQGLEVCDALKAKGLAAGLININEALPRDWTSALDHLSGSGRLIVLDDSKGLNRPSDRFLLAARETCPEAKIVALRRTPDATWSQPQPDILEVDMAVVCLGLKL